MKRSIGGCVRLRWVKDKLTNQMRGLHVRLRTNAHSIHFSWTDDKKFTWRVGMWALLNSFRMCHACTVSACHNSTRLQFTTSFNYFVSCLSGALNGCRIWVSAQSHQSAKLRHWGMWAVFCTAQRRPRVNKAAKYFAADIGALQGLGLDFYGDPEL